MSVEVIKEQIFQFLSSTQPEVMAIKGEWGIGKTFSWKKFLKEACSEDKIIFERYSYVSLFGINSLDAFKYAIFENVITKDIIGTEASIETLKSNTADLIQSLGRKSINLFKGATTSSAIETISFLSLNKILICIDDLERKGKELDIKDVLGLVSLLKEQKDCKIVLLLNEGEDGFDDYEKYREKVIDIELTFSPTSKECAEIAYSENTSIYLRLKELTTSLGIRNIRILKKIERLVKLVIPIVKEFDPEVLDQVLRSIVLYTWSYFCSGYNKEIPTLEFITQRRYLFWGLDDEKPTEQEDKWLTTLQEYDYDFVDDLDILLMESIKVGYFIETELREELAKKNHKILEFRAKSSFTDAWELYHGTFENNGDEVVRAIYYSFKNNCKHITPEELDRTVSLFRGLDEENKASELIDIYIEKKKMILMFLI